MARTYTLTCADVIAKVRTLTQDATVPYRSGDDEIIGWINDCVKTLVSLVPQQFTQMGTLTCVAGFRQTLDVDRAHSLVDVVGVPLADLQALTQFMPGWQNVAAGAIQNWMRPVNEPLSFYCYPPSAPGQQLAVEYVEVPDDFGAPEDLVPIPESYEPAFVAYAVAMTQAKDDESVDTGRAQQFMADFVGRVKGV